MADDRLQYYTQAMKIDEETDKPMPKVAIGGEMDIKNDKSKVRDGFEIINPDMWDVVQDPNDIIELAGNTQGSGYLKISKSIYTENTATELLSKFILKAPVRIGLGMSISQRLNDQSHSITLLGVNDLGEVVNEVALPPSIAISTLSQSTTTLTVNTAIPHGFVPNDRIQIWGSPDSRANYGIVLVATVVTPTQFTVTSTQSATIPSVTINSIAGGFAQKLDPFAGANNGLCIAWEGTSANNAKMISRSNKSALYQGTDTSLGTNHTNGTQANTQNFADAWNPSYMLDIRYKAEAVVARTLPMDSTNGYGGVIKRSQVVPDIATGYKVRIRAFNHRASTMPVARVVNAVKSASTTATITTDVPHGLTTTDYIQIYGNRDQTNFANLSTVTQVASVVNATTFTVAYGASYTGNTRGGVVVRVQGGATIAPIGQTIQSISASGGQMTIVGSTTWSGFSIGDTVEVAGLVDSASATMYPQYEGGFKVLSLSTSTLIVAAPNIANFASINVGGALFKRTDLRLHFFRAIDYTRHTVEVDGSIGNYADSQEALPVGVLNMPSLTIANGQTAHDSTITGNPFRIGGRAMTANYAGVATGEAADLVTTVVGALIQKPYSIPEGDFTYAGTAVVNTTDVVLKAAGAAGIRNYLTGIQIMNTHATVATEVVVKDGSTVIWRGWAPAVASATAQQPVLINVQFPTPLRTTAAVALNFACITTGANVYVNAQGYQAP